MRTAMAMNEPAKQGIISGQLCGCRFMYATTNELCLTKLCIVIQFFYRVQIVLCQCQHLYVSLCSPRIAMLPQVKVSYILLRA